MSRFARRGPLDAGDDELLPPARFRFGVAQHTGVAPLDEIARLARLGYDYVEARLSALVALPEGELAALRQRLAAAPLRVEAVNGFVPASVTLTGPHVDADAVRAYLRTALARADGIGARIVVFGSGAARAAPPGFGRHDALAQLTQHLHFLAAEITRRGYDLSIAVEPLRQTESNLVNTLGEALALAATVDHPRVGVAVDLFQLLAEAESLDVVLHAGARLLHTHVATPHRRFPRADDDHWCYEELFTRLRAIDYHGRVSVEASARRLLPEAAAALSLLRSLAS